MYILAIIFSGIIALCAILSFFGLNFPKLKTEWKLRRIICKLGGAKEIREMTGEEFSEKYSKEVGKKPVMRELLRVQEITGADLPFYSFSELIFRREEGLSRRGRPRGMFRYNQDGQLESKPENFS